MKTFTAPQFSTDLVSFAEKIHMKNFSFCVVLITQGAFNCK